MDEHLAEKLLASIEADNLVLFCGAGLSMAEPSELPSAAAIAEECATRFHRRFGRPLDSHLRDDLEAIAEDFRARNDFQLVFIQHVVPWPLFSSQPNDGHRAIADFLACRAAAAAITTNFDSLLEQAAEELGDHAFYPCLEQSELNASQEHAPLLKLHGCWKRDRATTIWCHGQLEDEPIRERLRGASAWMAGVLPQRDFVFVGFWSDWSYLNDVLESCVATMEPRMVVIVNPDDSDSLRQKAPSLWQWAQQENVHFFHEQSSGSVFLDDLRERFSRRLLTKLLLAATEDFTAMTAMAPLDGSSIVADWDKDSLYDLRRDLLGASRDSISRRKRPEEITHAGGVAVLFLAARGATSAGPYFQLEDLTIRVIAASGRPLSKTKEGLRGEPPDPLPPDLVICAGALDDGGVPGHLVRGEVAPSVVRNGVGGTCVTLENALAQLADPEWETDENS